MPPETPPPQVVFGRATGTVPTPGGVATPGTVPPPEFDEQDSLEAQKERQARAWSNLTFKIRYRAVLGITLLAAAIALVALAILGWLVVIFLIHYTIPKLGWLSPSEFSQLTGVYRNFAAFAVPAILAANAWLVAWFGSRRWFGQSNG